ncbi:unnamed protein product [Mycena citricolor]|uniref:F-box domain-containing protein n=1 Tax=Mycena citricolor TaxID=2018698 RepID=A0AAD2Q7I1_9AGAR|nr:unnamed protein product [Mycena citricolor]
MDTVKLRKRISALDRSISILQDQLRVLEAEKADLATRLCRSTYLVETLPPEITAQIFMHYIAALEGPTLSPALLGVCRTWRQVALGTPGLWNDIFVSSDHPQPDALLERWVERTGPRIPLDLELNTTSRTMEPLLAVPGPERWIRIMGKPGGAGGARGPAARGGTEPCDGPVPRAAAAPGARGGIPRNAARAAVDTDHVPDAPRAVAGAVPHDHLADAPAGSAARVADKSTHPPPPDLAGAACAAAAHDRLTDLDVGGHVDGVIPLVMRSECTITHLRLSEMDLDSQAVYGCLRALRAVTHLVVSSPEPEFFPDFLRIFAAASYHTEDPPVILLPLLQSFVVEECDSVLELESILPLLEARCKQRQGYALPTALLRTFCATFSKDCVDEDEQFKDAILAIKNLVREGLSLQIDMPWHWQSHELNWHMIQELKRPD